MSRDQDNVYRIVIKGRLREDWSEWLEGVTISHQTTPEGTDITVLVGSLKDQSALHGILARLHSLNLELLSVQCLGPGKPDDLDDKELT